MRLELIHPLLVHFPIALLSTGVLVRFAAIWGIKRERFLFLLPASWMILTLGVLTAWLTVIAGEIARDIVGPTLKDITPLNEHELHAYMTAMGFTLGLLLDWLRAFAIKRGVTHWMVKKVLTALICLLYLGSLANLIITGGLGAILVYEDGAAVR